jgi:hypothetical protein
MRTVSFPLVRADELDRWSDRFEAAAILPELVRRLLWATASPTRLEIRAEGGVRLSGYDGVVETSVQGPLWPDGMSIWELSVSSDPAGKAQRDYQKRTDELAAPARASLTYVTATSRRWPGKGPWAEQKRAEGAWGDVRVVDADDLGAWLAQAPAVALWFASTQFGRPVAEEEDATSYATSWAYRTDPPLPIDLPLRGSRAAAALELEAWCRAPAATRTPILTVVDDTQDEAVAFTVAALASKEAMRSSTIVVHTEASLRWHARDPGVVLVPTFPVAGVPSTMPARVVITGSRHEPTRSGALVLRRLKREELARALEEVGIEPDTAKRLADDAGGRILPLQRLLHHVERPQWARDVPMPILQALILLGSWHPKVDGDRQALVQLGVDAVEAETWCARLLTAPGSPIARRQGGYAWNSRGDAWSLLASTFPARLLSTFEAVALQVLGEDDTTFDLQPDQRIYAPFLKKGVSYSPAMREAVCEGLCRLAVGESSFEW